MGGMCDCVDALRWCRAGLRFGPGRLRHHFEAQRKIVGCLACGQLRLPEETYYACSLCDDWELCEPCYRSGAKPHSHRLYREVMPIAVDASVLRWPAERPRR